MCLQTQVQALVISLGLTTATLFWSIFQTLLFTHATIIHMQCRTACQRIEA